MAKIRIFEPEMKTQIRTLIYLNKYPLRAYIDGDDSFSFLTVKQTDENEEYDFTEFDKKVAALYDPVPEAELVPIGNVTADARAISLECVQGKDVVNGNITLARLFF